MNEELFNKISIPYQNFSDRYYNYEKRWDRFYAIYDPQMFIVRGKNLEFLKQFEAVPYGAFFTEEHINSNYYSLEYLDSKCIVITDKDVRVHDNFAQILFFYLINEFKDDIRTFLKLLRSEAFDVKFYGSYRTKDGEFKYSPSIQTKVYDFLCAHVPNYSYISYLFGRASGLIYTEGSEITVRADEIEKRLESNDSIFNFNGFEIK